MDFDRLPSFLISFCLHLAVAALVLFWPASKTPPPLEATIFRLSDGPVPTGKEGKPTPDARRESAEQQRGRPEREIPKPPERPEERVVAQIPTPERPDMPPEVKPVPKPEEVSPPVEPDAVPIQKIEVPAANATQKPPVQPEQPVTVAERKPEEKPPVKPEEKPKEPEKKPPPKKKASLADALASLDKEVKQGDRRGNRRAQSATGTGKGQNLSSALDDLGKRVGGAGDDQSGVGPGGRGGDGDGVLGAYQDSIISRVRPNWHALQQADRRNYVAVVNIVIDLDGTIKGARILTPSGNTLYDATVINAIAATATLEAPPGAQYTDINITFSMESLRH